MKKKYENPTIQKIAFSYRDQVVAASGAEPTPENSTGNGGWSWREIAEGIFKWIWELLG